MMNPLLGCFGWRPMRMPRANEKTTKIWLYTLKLPLMILAAVTAFSARYRYAVIAEHPDAFPPTPYYRHVEIAQLLAYVSLVILFPWCLSSAALVYTLRGTWLLSVGIIDLGIAVTLATGLGMQGDYLPGRMSRCVNAGDWKVDDRPGLFFIVAPIGDYASPKDACESFVYTWELAGSTLFFQFLITYIGVFFDEREGSILNPFRPLSNFIFAIIGPPMWFTDHMMPRIRFGYQYAIKAARRMRSKEPAFKASEPYKPRYDYQVPNPKLIEVLNIEHILLEVIENSHYEDIINFSLASRAVREAVFPGGDLELRVPKLKKHCCNKESKVGCFYCNKKVCLECEESKFWPGLPARRHIKCVQWCSRCYYLRDSRRSRDYRKPCVCRILDRSNQTQSVCRTCAARDVVELQRERHKRYEKEARDIACGANLPPGEQVKCGNCKKELKHGARFWICGCLGECRDPIHPGFVSRKKERDAEKGEEKTEGAEGGSQGWTAMFGFRSR